MQHRLRTQTPRHRGQRHAARCQHPERLLCSGQTSPIPAAGRDAARKRGRGRGFSGIGGPPASLPTQAPQSLCLPPWSGARLGGGGCTSQPSPRTGGRGACGGPGLPRFHPRHTGQPSKRLSSTTPRLFLPGPRPPREGAWHGDRQDGVSAARTGHRQSALGPVPCGSGSPACWRRSCPTRPGSGASPCPTPGAAHTHQSRFLPLWRRGS